MTYTLYGHRGSGSSIVELALAEIGAAYEVRAVSLDTHDQLKASYTTVNPQRKIPSLVMEDGETLTESVAILLTLNERHPESGLMPPPRTPERAQALRWLLFVATELYPIVEIIDYPERFTSEPQAHAEATREIARDIWRARWLILEDAIAGDPYLLGSGFSLTDIYVAVVSRWVLKDEWRLSHIPKIERLTGAVAARCACEAESGINTSPVVRIWRSDTNAEFDCGTLHENSRVAAIT